MTSLTDERRQAAFDAVLRTLKHVRDEEAKDGWVSRLMDAIAGCSGATEELELKLRGADFVTRLEAATIVAASIEYLAGTIQMCFGSQVSDSDQDEKPISAKAKIVGSQPPGDSRTGR